MSARRGFAAVCVVLAALAATVAVASPSSAAVRVERADIRITANKEFTKANGVRWGNGSMEYPYMITRWNVGNLVIQNTSKHVVIHDVTVRGQMVLDWIGSGTHVHQNTINDLRVNQNVRRTGRPTSGYIGHNKFNVVGQLRHWDGVFERNIVGNATDRFALGGRAVNFDGFNGAKFRENVIYGYMDARVHGHHHSSGYGTPSHMHTTSHHGMVDHSRRWHEVFIAGNRITTTHEYALAYLDTNHAGNDRTAPSEQDRDLNKPHVHYTRARIIGNRLSGAGVIVNVFNSADPHHLGTRKGSMEIKDNRISLARDDFFSFRQLKGIEVVRATDLVLRIEGNSVKGVSEKGQPFAFFEQWDDNAGIYLHLLDKAMVGIRRNRVVNRAYGVRAEQFTPSVRWLIDDLWTQNVSDRVYYDQSVKKPA